MRLIGVDTGGTFSDLVMVDTETQVKRLTKVHSVPKQPEMGYLNAVDELFDSLSDIDLCLYGTTVATNAIIQRVGAKVGMITTKGFRDVIEIMRGNRAMFAAYDLQWTKPAPLVPRHLRLEVDERIDFEGNVVKPLNEEQVVRAAEFLLGHGCNAIAICFMESYRNPIHEQQAARILEDRHPDLAVSVSSRILPQWREYERFSTAVADAFMKPVLSTHLSRLQDGLHRRGYSHSPMIMKCNGGVFTAAGAERLPVATFSSGPAAGVIAAQFYGKKAGFGNIIEVEVGGTSADLSLIRDGRHTYTTETEISPGIPLKIPMIDVRSIGAGGGSIGWIDPARAIKVGPMSAGADPGPTCYGTGGTEPTLTDANLILGRLNPHNFLGGAQPLHPDLAHAAIGTVLAEPLGLSVQEAAWGIVQVAVANMVQAARSISAGRGWDPREFALLVAGGAGPLHGPLIARELGIKHIVAPPHPGLMSATGLLLTDLRFDVVQSLPSRLEEGGYEALKSTLEEMASKVLDEIRSEGHPGETRVELSVDMRYAGQNYEINLPIDLTNATVERLAEQFDDEHWRLYGFSQPERMHEIVNARATGVGVVDLGAVEGLLALHPSGDAPTEAPEPRETREVFDEIANDFIVTAIYDRQELPVGPEIKGPAVIEEMDSTTVVPSDGKVAMDDFGNLIITFH